MHANGPEHSAAIVGMGLATPLGASLPQTWDALLAGQSIAEHARVPITFESNCGRASALALRVAREAIAVAGWDDATLNDSSTALVVGTSKGPVERWLTPLLHMDISPYVAGGLHPTGLGEIAAGLAAQLRLGGPRMTMSAACASGLEALIRGTMMIRGEEAQRVLVVAVESSLHPLFLGNFARLGVLASASVGCRPFDQRRDGFLMSEAAAAVCLEKPPASGKRTTIVVDRFALGGDATHLTGFDPDGLTLHRLIATVIDGRPMDLVHAHATGTSGDLAELSAIESAVVGAPPVLYSHKGSLGHSLGAAGLVSFVLNCIMHQTGIVPGNVRTQEPLTTQRVVLSAGQMRREIMRSMAIGAGFGGAMAAVGLKTI